MLKRSSAPEPSWRATANGLEGAAAQFTDTVMVLDEFGTVDARDAAQAVPARGEHEDAGGRREHPQGDQPEIPSPAGPRAPRPVTGPLMGPMMGRVKGPLRGPVMGTVTNGPFGRIPLRRLGREHALEPLSQGVGHSGGRDGG